MARRQSSLLKVGPVEDKWDEDWGLMEAALERGKEESSDSD